MKENFVQVIYSKRKSLSLTVKGDGTILVRAPNGCSKRLIDDFIFRHQRWIHNCVSSVQNISFSLSDGANLTLFGSDYVIQTGKTSIGNGVIFLPAENRERALVSLLKKFSLQTLQTITSTIAEKYLFTYSSVRITSARTRWGSCNREGRIAFSFRVAFLPPELVEYVVVHELSHTVFLNHSASFWGFVAFILPDYRERRKRLKQMGAIMDLL